MERDGGQESACAKPQLYPPRDFGFSLSLSLSPSHSAFPVELARVLFVYTGPSIKDSPWRTRYISIKPTREHYFHLPTRDLLSLAVRFGQENERERKRKREGSLLRDFLLIFLRDFLTPIAAFPHRDTLFFRLPLSISLLLGCTLSRALCASI